MCKLPVQKIALSGAAGKGKFALVDGDYDGEWLSSYTWAYNTQTGYAVGKVQGKQVYLHVLAAGKPPKGLWVDHKNRNRLDCRSCNLRWVTPSQSAANRVKHRGKSGYFGVNQNFHTIRGVKRYYQSWVVYCQQKYIGSFKSPEEAAHAYDMVAFKTFGELATLNFPNN